MFFPITPHFSGSSPRMRGTRCRQLITSQTNRFIPAYAGNTMIAIEFIVIFTVHPRVCGEHTFHNDDSHEKNGSSPRMRGTQHSEYLELTRERFIPAYAGNTSSSTDGGKSKTVHPRVCGEHQYDAWLFSSSCGSSPRMRGTLKHMLAY